MNADERREGDLTERIISCALRVSNELGCGFLEKVYENAMAQALKKAGLCFQQQVPVDIWFDGVVVGQYVVDILVESKVILELKAVKEFDEIHKAQCINYLKSTGLRLCLLINFGKPKLEIKRIVHNYPR